MMMATYNNYTTQLQMTTPDSCSLYQDTLNCQDGSRNNFGWLNYEVELRTCAWVYVYLIYFTCVDMVDFYYIFPKFLVDPYYEPLASMVHDTAYVTGLRKPVLSTCKF